MNEWRGNFQVQDFFHEQTVRQQFFLAWLGLDDRKDHVGSTSL